MQNIVFMPSYGEAYTEQYTDVQLSHSHAKHAHHRDADLMLCSDYNSAPQARLTPETWLLLHISQHKAMSALAVPLNGLSALPTATTPGFLPKLYERMLLAN